MSKLDTVKKGLQDRLKTLGVRIGEIEDDLRTAPSADWEEQAIETEGDEVLEGLENSALSEAAQIQDALRRIDAGKYDECATCGEPIGAKRLEALPYANQCIRCAEESDG
jgi:RNA polymerase-binding transcription factor DksA